MKKLQRPALLIAALAVLAALAAAQAPITSPKQEFGFNVGDDYVLINYTQLVAYWKKLAKESDRMKLFEIGKTSEGRTMLMAVISAPRNLAKLELYKQISQRLSAAQRLTDADARRLAVQGRAVVWIDGGLHASEVAGSQQIIELVYQMLSGQDAETLRILDDVILLACPVNPDGQELVADWYMREKDPAKRTMGGLPRLYQKYVGHDNNRDFYMVTQPETTAVSRQLFIDWDPQIIYNHHQSGPAGTVLFCPPFRDPFYYYFDPMIPLGTDLVGLAMHERFAAEGKPGAIMRSGASYSTWWNGGLRSTGYYHNAIGILTEIIGSPTPQEIPFIPDRVLPKGDYPYPIMPQKWHFRSTIDYLMTANKAILDYASRQREELLYDRYIMGRNAVAKGGTDTWTFEPQQIAGLQAQIEKDRAAASPAGTAGAPAPAAGGAGFGGMRGGGAPLKYYDMLRDPAKRDPRGYVIPAAQADFPTAVKFVNTLIKSGIVVHQATKPFTVLDKTYAAGSFVVKTAQAYRAHVISMFEPQDHPNDFAYPGGPPRPPYDSAGWTVAFQMGVTFDRILEAFDGPFVEVKGFATPPAGTMPAVSSPVGGYLLSHQVNDAAIVVNRLLKAKEDVFWLKKPLQTASGLWPAGTIFIAPKPSVLPILTSAAKDLGLSFEAVDVQQTPNDVLRLKPPRLAVWDTYGGSMDSGWAQWILTQFEFPFDVIYAPTLDAGNLIAKYDVLVFLGGGIPAFGPGARGGRGGGGFGGQMNPESIPAQYRGMIGSITADKTIPQLRKFVEEGGTILTVGGATSLGYHFGLPIANHLTEKTADGREVAIPTTKFYVPGSILKVRVDPANPIAYGMPDAVDVFFDSSPVFDLLPDAAQRGASAACWFESANPLRSGWVWGDEYLWRGTAVVTAGLGKGKVALFGPEITFRGQPHGTFKLLFNGIFLSAAESGIIGGPAGGAKN